MAGKNVSYKEGQNMDMENNMSYANMLRQNPYMVLWDLNDNSEFPSILNRSNKKPESIHPNKRELFNLRAGNYNQNNYSSTRKMKATSPKGKFITTLIIIFQLHQLHINRIEQILIY